MLNKQEYRPAQQNREIKKLVDLRRRHVGETRGKKLFQHILPLFSSSIYEKLSRSATYQGQGSINQRLLKISRAKKKLLSDHLELRNSSLKSCRRIIIRNRNLSSTYKFPPQQVTVVFPSRVNWRHFNGQLQVTVHRYVPPVVGLSVVFFLSGKGIPVPPGLLFRRVSV